MHFIDSTITKRIVLRSYHKLLIQKG